MEAPVKEKKEDLVSRCIKSALYILFVYLLYSFGAYLWFIYNYDISESKKPKILLVWGDGVGEKEQTYRFQIAAKRVGIDLRVISNKYKDILPNIFYKPTIESAAKVMQPDLILTIERHIPPLKAAPNYIVLDQSKQAYFSGAKHYTKAISPKLYEFYGLLPSFPEIDELAKHYKDLKKEFRGFSWYPTIQKTNYVNNPPKRLFYPGGILKDITRSSNKYKEMFAILDKNPYLEIRGHKKHWGHTPKSRRTPVKFDGKSLLDAQNSAGMSLVLHDSEHLYGHVPSSRIFEAAAANTIIIADKHNFILNNFGDNVLYIDVEKNAKEIAKQIETHVEWIKNNPELAAQKANTCHKIFLERYTLEKQLEYLVARNKSYINES